MKDLKPGDKVLVNGYEGLPSDTVGIIRKVYSDGQASVSIDPLVNGIQREGVWFLSSDGTIHIVLHPSEFETYGKIIVS